MRKAFTLIEVMVVLSILAIIAILGYNFFGSTMKEATVTQAATKLYRDLTLLENGFELYVQKKGVEPSTDASFQDDLVAEGILKSIPMPPSNIKNTTNCNRTDYVPGGTLGYIHSNNVDYWGGAGTDPRLTIICIDTDVCKKFNDLYTSLGPTIPSDGTHAIVGDHGAVCYDQGSTNDFVLMKVIEIR